MLHFRKYATTYNKYFVELQSSQKRCISTGKKLHPSLHTALGIFSQRMPAFLCCSHTAYILPLTAGWKFFFIYLIVIVVVSAALSTHRYLLYFFRAVVSAFCGCAISRFKYQAVCGKIFTYTRTQSIKYVRGNNFPLLDRFQCNAQIHLKLCL